MNTIFCRNCGKELSDEAFMCPNCGTPVNGAPAKPHTKAEPVKTEPNPKATALSVVAFVLSMISFVTGIIFGAFFFVYTNSALLLYVLPVTTILPAFAALSIGAYLLYITKNEDNRLAKSLSVTAVVFASVVILFLFIAGCLLATDALYSYGSINW